MKVCGAQLPPDRRGQGASSCMYDAAPGEEHCSYHAVLLAGLTQDSFGKWWGEPWRPPRAETNGDGWRPAAVDIFEQLLERQSGTGEGPWW